MNTQNRIAIEKKIVRKAIRTLKDAGWLLVGVFDGEEYQAITTEKEAIETGFSVDEFKLYFKKDDSARHAIYFVLGNDGYDVICDYSYGEQSFFNAMNIINQYAEKFDV